MNLPFKTIFLISFLLLMVVQSVASCAHKESDTGRSTQSCLSVCCASTGQPAENPTLRSYFGDLFDPDHRPAKWASGQWSSFEGWFFILSDFVIFLSYMIIPLILMWYFREKALPGGMRKMLIFFLCFIVLCGLTHLVDMILFWVPVYRLSGMVKAMAGVFSLLAIVAFVYITPVFLKYKSPGEVAADKKEMEKINEALKKRVAIRNFAIESDRKKYEIQASKLKLALGVGKIGIWDWDLKSNYLVWDKNMFLLFDYDEKEFKNSYEDFASRVHPEDIERVAKEINDCISQKIDFVSEFRLVLRDGTIKYVGAMGTFIYDDEGKAWKMIGSNQDITSIKMAEISLWETNQALELKVKQRTRELEDKIQELQEANDDLKSFSYSVSHDLRAPLRALSGFSDALYEKYRDQLGEKGNRWVHFIKRNADRMDELIEDILTLSRVTQRPLRKQDVDMRRLIDEVFEENKAVYPGISVRLDIADIKNSIGDEGMIKQLWHNLISNAIKYSSKNELAEIRISCSESDNKVVYAIRDNGVGFEEGYKDKLFLLFQRLHPENEFEGTGIGLTIAKKIVIKHGGEIWAESQPNQGATFYFSLPKVNHSNGIEIGQN